MPKLIATKDKETEVYQTKALNEAQFIMAFSRISKEQKENRRKAKHTLTPALLNRSKKLSVDDLVRLGKKSTGENFTYDDLKRFERLRKKYKKRRGKLVGITFKELVAKSRTIDVKRANNQSNDNRGITRASLIALRKGNIAFIRVKASKKSKHQEHLVKIRFDEWEDCLHEAKPNDENYLRAVKAACLGRVSIDCDCGRHQYWYRYMATIGNYQLKPPSELSFPKLKNPELIGVTCKHVIKAMVMLQSPAWQRPLAAQMKLQARTIGFGDDDIRNHYLTDEEKKAGSKNRKLTVNQEQARSEYKKYLLRQQAISKKLKENPEKNKLTLARLKKAKAKNKALEDKNKQLRDKNKELQAKSRENEKRHQQAIRDSYKIQLKSTFDMLKNMGVQINEADTLKSFAQAHNLSLAAVLKMRKEL